MSEKYMSSIAKEQPVVDTEAQTLKQSEQRVAIYEVAIKNAKTPEEAGKFADKLTEELEVQYAYYEEKSQEASQSVDNAISAGKDATEELSNFEGVLKTFTTKVAKGSKNVSDFRTKLNKYDIKVGNDSKSPSELLKAKVIKSVLALALLSIPTFGGVVAYDAVKQNHAEMDEVLRSNDAPEAPAVTEQAPTSHEVHLPGDSNIYTINNNQAPSEGGFTNIWGQTFDDEMEFDNVDQDDSGFADDAEIEHYNNLFK
jgi:hypothetical protein